MNKDKTAPELKIIGNVMPSGHNVGNIYDPDGISPTIMLNHGYPALILEEATDNDMNQLIQVAQIYDKEKNPTNGRVYSPNSISPTLTTPTGGNSMPLILAMEQIPFNTADEGLAYTITTRYGAMCASNLIDGNFPMAGILTIENPTEEMKRQIEDGSLNFDKGMPKETSLKSCAMRGRGKGVDYHQELEVGDDVANALTTVQKDSMILEGEDPSIISLMSWNRPGGDVGDVSPAITTSAWEQNNFVKLPDGDSPMVMADPRKNYGRLQPSAESSPTLLSTDYKSPHLVVERGDGELDMSDPETRIIKRAADHVAQEYGTQTRFRIRKLTPRECYRLMDVPEEYIDRLLASGISKSQHYKLAGNSIVVSCLYHIFKNLFTNEIPVNQQLSLF
ncbi:DNA cytosine methyltransferase [Muribaculum sp.]|uniref:DNA cytosine methyltransferase n=1 Tax=Muribaculum sp. TaxID=1918611 RepID=UPI00258FFC02|nr:DNA cytosine methyltransferase [Muribaculum sp.]MCX4278962.1 DNA cytosine methyltransferase [Muribaculum sp.]